MKYVTQEPATPPRVVLNASLWATTGDYRAAGISRHIAGLVGALLQQPEVQLALVATNGGIARRIGDAATVIRLPRWARWPAGRIACEQAVLPFVLGRGRADLYHSPAYAMPVICPAPAVVTVHDLSFFRLPQTFGRLQGAYLRWATRGAARHAAALIAVSEFTRRETVALLGTPPDRIHVVPNGVAEEFRPADPPAVAAYRARRGLPERFILAVGTVQPRKNLVTVIEAYARLRLTMPDPPALVVAGAAGWGRDEVAERTRALGLEASVRRLGFCDDHELPLLYTAAAVVTVPSLYEGFGLPVVEAMACGTPVIVADTSSLPEVAGDAALRVPATDVEGWVRALRQVLDDPALAARLSAAGAARAQRFRWSRAAAETVAVYRQVVANGWQTTARGTHRGG